MVIYMIDNEIFYIFFEKRQEKIEENIQEEYHKKIKQIRAEDEEERNNIKMNIISELYYKQGIEDGLKIILNIIKNNK